MPLFLARGLGGVDEVDEVDGVGGVESVDGVGEAEYVEDIEYIGADIRPMRLEFMPPLQGSVIFFLSRIPGPYRQTTLPFGRPG